MRLETEDRTESDELRLAIQSREPVSGLTHTFYRYPARFSPIFAGEAIRHFSALGEIVLDPFMGGGTSLVEARALGRHGVGSDVSSLAVFLSKTKTAIISDHDRQAVIDWAIYVASSALNLRNEAFREDEWIKDGYQRNITGRHTWPIRKTIELALGELDRLTGQHQQMFARCAVLKAAQWALDCKKTVPSASAFRAKFVSFVKEMAIGSKEFSESCRRSASSHGNEPLCLHQSALDLDTTYSQSELPPPKLVLTSPPYPGVHVVYHRWQVFGRRETPAAFWIAGTKDGAGSSFYTFGDRQQEGLADYFSTAFQAFRAIARISDKRTTVVQMVAFSDPDSQLARYLGVMNEAGFEELPRTAGHTWRTVPNRKWYAVRPGAAASSSEVVLFHRLTR